MSGLNPMLKDKSPCVSHNTNISKPGHCTKAMPTSAMAMYQFQHKTLQPQQCSLHMTVHVCARPAANIALEHNPHLHIPQPPPAAHLQLAESLACHTPLQSHYGVSWISCACLPMHLQTRHKCVTKAGHIRICTMLMLHGAKVLPYVCLETSTKGSHVTAQRTKSANPCTASMWACLYLSYSPCHRAWLPVVLLHSSCP